MCQRRIFPPGDWAKWRKAVKITAYAQNHRTAGAAASIGRSGCSAKTKVARARGKLAKSCDQSWKLNSLFHQRISHHARVQVPPSILAKPRWPSSSLKSGLSMGMITS